jgi:branched-chain amino acid transport system ATP-binding protein
MRVEDSAGLRTADLSVRYGGLVANDRVSLTVAPGEIVGLIGPNGAGKTTFVDAVTGFTSAEGEVRLGAERVDGMPAHQRRRLGLSRTWQAGELFGNLTVAQNIEVAVAHGGFGAILRDLFLPRRGSLRATVTEALSAVGLEGIEDTVTRDLSLGQQKLVGVARALAGSCQVVLLDEPAAGLDSQESLEFAERVRGIADRGPGVLLIDHDMSLVLGVCDRVYVMEFGTVIFTGTPEQARTDPQVIAAYLGVPMESANA